MVAFVQLYNSGPTYKEHPYSLVHAKPNNPVTPAMISLTAREAGLSIPELNLVDTSGRRFDLYSILNSKPVFLLFILDTCPCSYEGEPFYNRIEKRLGQKIQFIGITNANTTRAKEWKHELHVQFPIVCDPDLKLMRMFKAQHSAFSFLILQNHRIAKMWPGFSQSLLANITDTLASTINEQAPKIDFSDAPLQNTSGCFFYASVAKAIRPAQVKQKSKA